LSQNSSRQGFGPAFSFPETALATGEDVRSIALSLDGTSEAPHFDRKAFRARRTYVTLAADEKSANVAFTPDEQEMKCLMLPEAFAPIPNKWGQQGWTAVTLSKIGKADLRAAIAMAYEHARPKPAKARR
jgi:hypothetical protein